MPNLLVDRRKDNGLEKKKEDNIVTGRKSLLLPCRLWKDKENRTKT